MNETIRIDTPVTPRQRDVLAFVEWFIGEHEYSPSVRDVAQHFEFQSTRSAADLLDALKAKGCIASTPGVARSIRVLRQDQAA